MVTDRPQGGGITITVEDFQRMQERITRLESERVRLSLSPAPPSKRSRSVHSYHELGAQPAVRINTPSPLAHGNTPQLARHQPVPYTPQNVDGIFPELQPTVGLDIRLILWPHVSPELIKTIMSNALDVTKLHVLIPAECRSSLELRIEDDSDKHAARLTRLLGLDDDDSVSKQVKLSKIAKHFPTKETFAAALLVWKGIKTYYGVSIPKAFGPSVDVHIIQMGKLCSLHP